MNDSPPTPARLLIVLIAFFSGAVCLIYELVWSRYLQLMLGVSVYAVAMVLACFMVGLALGAWHLGRVIDRGRHRGRMLLAMELAIGLYIVLSPLLYHELTKISDRSIRVALSLASLIVPTYWMGGTFPAFVRIIARMPEQIGSDVGLIYAVNTIGGAIGAMVTGFVLIGAIGLSGSMYLAGGISALVAGMILIVMRWQPLRQPSPRVPQEPKKRRRPKLPGAEPSRLVYRVAIVFGIAGFTALAFEVCWTRILTLFFKDSIYDLTIVLTAFLSGLAIGSVICGRLIRKRKSAIDWLALVQILIGAWGLLGLYLIDFFPYWINQLQTNTAAVQHYGPRYWLAGNAIRFGYAFVLMLVPTCLFGATFPLVSQICVRNINTVGTWVGGLDAINTIGAAAGAIVGGFVFIRLLGLSDSITLISFINILAGLILLRSMVMRGIILISVMLLAAMVPPWDRLRMSVSFLDPAQSVEQILSQDFYREDVHGITSVVSIKPSGPRYLITNRLFTQNTSESGGTEDHRRLGHIPMLLHPGARSSLVVGLGAGITLRGIAEHPVQLIDCVEISPGVVEAANYFLEENNNVLKNPKVHVILDDARDYMNSSTKTYDVIVLDIFHPMSGGSSMIYSREYFQLCRQRMAPDGLVCQWLPIHQLSMEDIKTIAATFRSVFPHTSLWFGLMGESTAAIGCIGSDQPLTLDYAQLAAQCQSHRELREINLNTPELLLSHFIMADEDLRAFCADAPIDTDDRPIVEMSAPKVAVQASRLGMLNLTELNQQVKDVAPLVKGLPAHTPFYSLKQLTAPSD